jgi:hypothetical protein
VSTFSFVGSGPDDKVKSYLDDILAIGIELERAAVEALFPKAPMPVETSRLEERLELLPADQARVEAPRPEETETPTPQDLGGTPSPSKQEETDFAIESAAQELRANPKLTRDQLYERLFGPKDKRAPSLKEKNWVTGWTVSRFRKKVWARARERAGLPLLAPKGRRPEK